MFFVVIAVKPGTNEYLGFTTTFKQALELLDRWGQTTQGDWTSVVVRQIAKLPALVLEEEVNKPLW